MIRLYHATKAYPGDPPALVGASLHVDKGEFVFVTGPSGAGKSTLLKLIFMQEQVTSGQVLVAGQNVAKLSRAEVARLRRRIGVVFQDFKLLENRTVAQNVAVALEVQGVAAREVQRRTLTTLRWVGLAEKADVVPSRLSGGEQQRVAIARALVGEPSILLADEPTGNLDAERSIEIMELLAGVSARGTTVMVATHDRALLARYARRVIILGQGRIVGDGEPDFDAAGRAG